MIMIHLLGVFVRLGQLLPAAYIFTVRVTLSFSKTPLNFSGGTWEKRDYVSYISCTR